uniref:transposase n=1 Tax=Candidatus Enterovibrio escicola TaxID=1927127 RepID=UPI0021DFE7DD|nr:transposase [Candidatus Enterovibrio escacola]
MKVPTANLDDKKSVSEIADEIWGCLYGDKYYIYDPLGRELADKGVTQITGVKKNMKPKVMKFWDRMMLWKRLLLKLFLTN